MGARGKHFAPVEVKDGVAIIRIDGPGKMNTIDDEFRQEIDTLWEVRGLCLFLCVWMDWLDRPFRLLERTKTTRK